MICSSFPPVENTFLVGFLASYVHSPIPIWLGFLFPFSGVSCDNLGISFFTQDKSLLSPGVWESPYQWICSVPLDPFQNVQFCIPRKYPQINKLFLSSVMLNSCAMVLCQRLIVLHIASEMGSSLPVKQLGIQSQNSNLPLPFFWGGVILGTTVSGVRSSEKLTLRWRQHINGLCDSNIWERKKTGNRIEWEESTVLWCRSDKVSETSTERSRVKIA